MDVIVNEMVKVRAHQSLAQAEAASEGHLHRGNDKADDEAGKAAGAVDTIERVAYMKELDNRIRWLRQVAKALHKQAWTDLSKAGKEIRRRGNRVGKNVAHEVEWRPALNAWGCKLCGRIVRGEKGAAMLRLSKRDCGSQDLLEGVGSGHNISLGWLDGAFSMACCSSCGRWRSS